MNCKHIPTEYKEEIKERIDWFVSDQISQFIADTFDFYHIECKDEEDWYEAEMKFAEDIIDEIKMYFEFP